MAAPFSFPSRRREEADRLRPSGNPPPYVGGYGSRRGTSVEKQPVPYYFPAMLSEREYMQRPHRSWWWSATVVLVVVNIIAFIIQKELLPELFTAQYLELSLAGLVHGYVWQLLTYQFLHGSIAHIFLNCWALFMFGREVEWAVGKTRFVILYFCSGVIGGMFQMAATLLWPQYFGGPEFATYQAVIGASAGVFGIVAAFAMLFPNQRLIMLLFFVIPINIRAKSLLWLVLVITTLGISFPNSTLVRLLGGNVAHFAHFGGILTGIAVSRFYFMRFLPPPIITE